MTTRVSFTSSTPRPSQVHDWSLTRRSSMQDDVSPAAAKKRLAGLPVGVVLILVVEFCERFCFCTIAGTLKFFLSQRLDYSSSEATGLAAVFVSLSYGCSFLGGVFADRFLGNYLTISTMSSWYATGAFMVAMAAIPAQTSNGRFVVAALLMAIGIGGVKPVIWNFGADQLNGDGDGIAKERWFLWFYWVISVGSVIAYGTTVQIATRSHSIGYATCYLIGALVAGIGITIFFCGSSCYSRKYLTSSTRICRPIISAFRGALFRSPRGCACTVAWLSVPLFFAGGFAQAISSNVPLAWATLVLGVSQLAVLTWAHCDNSFLAPPAASEDLVAKSAAGDSLGQVSPAEVSPAEVRLTFRAVPPLIVANTVFGVAYSMSLGPFVSQVCQMDLRLSWIAPVNGAFFALTESLTVTILIPIFEVLLFPLLRRFVGRRKSPKVFGGFAAAACAMIAAILLERARRSAPVLAPHGWTEEASILARFPNMTFDDTYDGPNAYAWFKDTMGQCVVDGRDWCSSCAPKVDYPHASHAESRSAEEKGITGTYMSDFHATWMILPYALIGAGGALVNPVLCHYSYTMAPAKTQAVSQAINLLFQGAFPPMFVATLSTILWSEQPNNLNGGHLEIFYYVCLVVIFVGFVAFTAANRACRLVDTSDSAREPPRAAEQSAPRG